MYNQRPVGKYKLNVCTNLPCQLRDGTKALKHLEAKYEGGIVAYLSRAIRDEWKKLRPA
jgi:NADH:ubiquinone oxidoreductase subunit E